MAGDLKPLPNVSEDMERELLRAISLDDGVLSQKLLGQGISAFPIFRGDENESGDLGTLHKPIAKVIAIKNALRIASTFCKPLMHALHGSRYLRGCSQALQPQAT